jgi:hypothetical protein
VVRIIHSIAFFRHASSAYEGERCGDARGVFFDNFVRVLIPAHKAVWGSRAELVVHHDDRVRDLPSFALLVKAAGAGELRLVACGEAKTLTGAMLWRLRPLYEKGVDWVVCRDLDSLPMHRDRSMVEEAIAAGALCHAILDSESHGGPLMGGMTAFQAETWRTMVPILPTFEEAEFNIHGSDQRYLNSCIWPRIAAKTFIHQRRDDVAYPMAMQTARTHPQVTDLDKIVRHIGAGYDCERALKALEAQ